MDVLDEVEIWETANDNHVLPSFVFAAQSRIKQRVGFYDPDIPGMSHCNLMITASLDHYRFMVEGYDQPHMHEQWKASREEKIEDALTYLEEVLQRQGIRVS